MLKIEIPETVLDKFKTEVEKLKKKAERLGVQAPEYKIVGSCWKTLPTTKENEEVSVAKFFNIEVEDVNVVLNDWKIVCRIQKNESNLVGVKNINNAFYYSYEENIPQECYLKSPALCEHCGRNISTRKTTYILRNVKTNEYKQVGSSCVHDFVSSTNNVESILAWITTFTEYVRGLAADKFEEVVHKKYYPTRLFLKLIVRMYAEAGFVESIPPTHDASYKYPSYYSFGKYILDHPKYDYDPNVDVEIEKILDFHRKTYEELSEKESLDANENRMRNASVAVLGAYMSEDDEYLTEFTKGVYYYYKHHFKELYNCNNEFLGKVGQNLQIRAKLWEISKHDGNYGEYYLVRFLTSDGYKLTSFVTLTNKFALYLERAHVGHELTFEARVKSHDEYKGENTTKINYIKNYKPFYSDLKVELGVSS